MSASSDLDEISTTSGGLVLASSVLAVVYVIGCPMAELTSAEAASWRPSREHLPWRDLVPTSSGGVASETTTADGTRGVAEVRRISGLTWDQLARVLGVARRSLHFWASGKPMLPTNQERLQRVLCTVRTIDRGTATENRRLLLEAGPGGVIALDLLAAGRFEDVARLLGTGTGPRGAATPAVSDLALQRRRPQTIADRAASSADRDHRDTGATRTVRVVRRK